MPDIFPVYQPRKPQESQYYRCIEDNFEKLEQVYDDQFATKYGFFRLYIKQVIYRYLDCGILHNGFGVSRWSLTCEEVLKALPHRHFVFSIPKILRRYFLYRLAISLDGIRTCMCCAPTDVFMETEYSMRRRCSS